MDQASISEEILSARDRSDEQKFPDTMREDIIRLDFQPDSDEPIVAQENWLITV